MNLHKIWRLTLPLGLSLLLVTLSLFINEASVKAVEDSHVYGTFNSTSASAAPSSCTLFTGAAQDKNVNYHQTPTQVDFWAYTPSANAASSHNKALSDNVFLGSAYAALDNSVFQFKPNDSLSGTARPIFFSNTPIDVTAVVKGSQESLQIGTNAFTCRASNDKVSPGGTFNSATCTSFSGSGITDGDDLGSEIQVDLYIDNGNNTFVFLGSTVTVGHAFSKTPDNLFNSLNADQKSAAVGAFYSAANKKIIARAINIDGSGSRFDGMPYNSAGVPNLHTALQSDQTVGACSQAANTPVPTTPPAATITPTLPPALACDFNRDQKRDMTDFDFWKAVFLGTDTLSSHQAQSDCSGDGKVDLIDFNRWRNYIYLSFEGN